MKRRNNKLDFYKIVKNMFVLVMILSVIVGNNIFINTEKEVQADIISETENNTENVTKVKELIDERTINSNTYLMSDGSKSMEIYAESIRYEEFGQLIEYDPTLIELNENEKNRIANFSNSIDVESYIAVNAKGDSKQYFPNKLDGQTSIFMCKEEYAFSIYPKTDGVIYDSNMDEQHIVYKSDQAISEYQYISQKNGIKENVIIAERPDSNKIEFALEMVNINLDFNKEEKKINFIDVQNGEIVGCIMPPNIINKKGEINYDDITYEIEYINNQTILALVISEKYLNNTDFPIVVDPTAIWFSDELPTAMVNSYQEFANYNMHSDSLGVWKNCYEGSGEQRVYLNLDNIVTGYSYNGTQVDWTDKEINAVTLSIKELNSNYTPGTVEIKKTLTSWSADTITWNTQPQLGEDNIATFECSGIQGTLHTIDLTNTVKNMILTGERNKGLALIAKEDGTGEILKGPEIGNGTGVGHMWIKVDYRETISLTQHSFETNQSSVYSYAYDNLYYQVEQGSSNVTQTMSELLGNNISSPLSMKPGSNLIQTNVNTYPYSAVVHIVSVYSDNSAQAGSGFVIGPDTVVTAGHCIYDEDLGMPVYVRICVKFTGTYNSYYETEEVVMPTKYVQNSDVNYDWAILTIEDDIGEETGWLGFQANDYIVGNKLINKSIEIVGYPNPNLAGGTLRIQYKTQGTVLVQDNMKIYYNASTLKGMSGGPILGDNYIVYGVHSLGPENDNNSGCYINLALYSLLKDHKAQGKLRYGYE